MIESYSFYPIDSRMYVIIENSKALIIDPCISDEAKESLQENHVKEINVILTHGHYDHISGVNWLREHFSDVNVICQEEAARACGKPNKNLSSFYEILFMGKDEATQEYVHNMKLPPYSCEVDQTFVGGFEMNWGGHHVCLKETPGHSKGSICILFDEEILFSGDTLVTGHDTITRLPGGSKKDFMEKTIPFLKSLDGERMVYPGHGEPQRLREFKYF